MKKGRVIEDVKILAMAAEGKCIARVENKVLFIKGVAPGDICDVKVTKSRKKFSEAFPISIKHYSEHRVDHFCSHFGVCGGCKWQHISYQFQLESKQKLVEEAFLHPLKLVIPQLASIMRSPSETHFRNKLEYTFSNHRWITTEELKSEEKLDRRGVGFHVPGRFDRVVDIEECYLQPEPSNKIRNALRDYAIKNNLSFYDFKKHSGFLRNLIIRNSTLGETMVIVQFGIKDEENIQKCMEFLNTTFPDITSLQFIINEKKNETFFDQEVIVFKGKDYIEEKLEGFRFRIGPKSFFQTNPTQALRLYQRIRDLAGLTGNEIVYDLYCGTGTIGIFLSDKAKFTLGIDSIPEAIEDAKVNASINSISSIEFIAGDMKEIFTNDLVNKYGKPDVIVCDPPRAGMHTDVVQRLLDIDSDKIVYVSCNPATQARDIALMVDKYEIVAMQPVDMFPHTQHVENIALLQKRS